MRNETLIGAFCAFTVLSAALISFTFGFDHAPWIISGSAIISAGIVAATYRFGAKGFFASMFLLSAISMISGFIFENQPVFSVGVGIAAGTIATAVADKAARAKQLRQQQERAKRQYDAYHRN